MLPKLFLAVAAAMALLAVAVPAGATTAGFCLMGICEGVAVPLPPLPVSPPPVMCVTVVSPGAANVPPEIVIVQVCPTYP
jgi:hypothetical protein